MLMQCVDKQPDTILMYRGLIWPSKSPDLSPIEHMWDALDNRIRNRPVQPRTRQELEIALPDESTLHIINEETLPSIHRYQGWPFDTLNCKFDEKQLLNHLLKRSLMHVSVSSFLLGKKTWIGTICK